MTDQAPLILAVLALAFAGPVPALLARARWTWQAPRAALVLWQALALAAVLAALGAGLAVGLQPMLGREAGPVGLLVHAAALTVTVVVAARLAWTMGRLAVTTRTRRRAHRQLVDLVCRSDARAPGVRVLDTPHPLAYCVPGSRPRVVVSAVTLEVLAPGELASVLQHEQAHARQRHDLVLEGFNALASAFPRVVRSRAALRSAALLVEMVADDAALARQGSVPLARALVRLADAPVPACALGAVDESGTVARLRRMQPVSPVAKAALAAAAYASAALVVVVPTVTVAVPWIARVTSVLS